MKIGWIWLLLIIYATALFGQGKTDPWLEQLFRSQGSIRLRQVLDQPDTFRYQFIYTQINRDARNRPHFRHFYLHADKGNYFNPASTVKLPVALAALEKLHALNKLGVDTDTPMFTDSSYSGQVAVIKDSLSANGWPSIGQYIREVFLVSDNDAYNRLYEFVGQESINQKLRQKGFTDTRITRRFMPMTEEENRHTNRIRFIRAGKLLYEQPPAYNETPFVFGKPVLIGRAHYDKNDSLIQTAMDFTTHNKFPLEDLQRMLQSVLFPQSVPPGQRFHLTASDYQLLYRSMSRLPRESRYPHYDSTEFFDSYTKFFFFRSGKQPIPSGIRVFNKAGWSYGFLTDAAYIVDFAHQVEFMVTACIYTNSDGVLNDNKYDYDSIGYPFFSETGRILYAFELRRKRAHKPDLKAFRLKYGAR